jgi:MSHA pilin protein MshA
MISRIVINSKLEFKLHERRVKMKILRSQKGFTLIELVLIIVILGILAAVAIPQFINLQADAQASNNLAYIGALRSALSMRIAEQLVKVGNNDVAPTDVIGTVATSNATGAFLQGRITTPSAPPATLTPNAGVCGTANWVSTVDIQGFATPTFSLNCGATDTDALTITCTAPAGCTL